MITEATDPNAYWLLIALFAFGMLIIDYQAYKNPDDPFLQGWMAGRVLPFVLLERAYRKLFKRDVK